MGHPLAYAAGGLLAGGAYQASKRVQTGERRDYGAEAQANLQAQINLAPQLFAAESSEAHGQPAYTELGLRTQRAALMGTGGEPGQLEMYEEQVAPMQRRIQAADLAAQREGDISAVERLGPRAIAAMEGADPTSQRIEGELSSQVFSDLKAQGQLTDMERRRSQQGSRASASARGLVYGQGSALSEQYNEFMTEDAKRMRSQQRAGQYISQRKSMYGDPFMAVLGRGSGISPQAGQGFMTGGQQLVAGSGPGLYNPESGYAQQMYNQQYQAQSAANTATQANRAALFGATMGAAGSIFGGYAQGRGRAGKEFGFGA